MTALLPRDHRLLVELIGLPTAGWLETRGAAPDRVAEAQLRYADAARELGFVVDSHEPADPATLTGDAIPEAVRHAVATVPGFLDRQPSLVLRLGSELPAADTVMFNVHLDTVAGDTTAGYDGERFTGRGAIDAKGPAVALLAGIRAARAADRAIGETTGVLIQAVAGEEGGALGVFGTRPLVERGRVGRLNVFCEPTGLRYLPRATASMTAAVRVNGRDAIDDRPGDGHNATVLLGFLAQRLALGLDAYAPGAVCVAGLHTGHRHNRVYGSGELQVNLPYGTSEDGARMEHALTGELARAVAEFSGGFGASPAYARTAADATTITELHWGKRGLPALGGRQPLDAWARDLLEHTAGLTRWPADEPAFTCDAIWMAGRPDAYTVVFGPGDLAANHAHADGEFADRAELDAYAGHIAALLLAFSRHRSGDGNP